MDVSDTYPFAVATNLSVTTSGLLQYSTDKSKIQQYSYLAWEVKLAEVLSVRESSTLDDGPETAKRLSGGKYGSSPTRRSPADELSILFPCS